MIKIIRRQNKYKRWIFICITFILLASSIFYLYYTTPQRLLAHYLAVRYNYTFQNIDTMLNKSNYYLSNELRKTIKNNFQDELLNYVYLEKSSCKLLRYDIQNIETSNGLSIVYITYIVSIKFNEEDEKIIEASSSYIIKREDIFRCKITDIQNDNNDAHHHKN